MELKIKKSWISIPMIAVFLSCSAGSLNSNGLFTAPELINRHGKILQDRILVPPGYTRVKCDTNSFGFYLRNLKMKADSSEVLLYDGKVKPYKVHAAVIDMEIGKRDLQQCADACIRLRAEYLRNVGKSSSIHFNLTNGFR
ncbi:MAG: DUF4846 domain-containing protein, partial [Flavobacteriales bacterium]